MAGSTLAGRIALLTGATRPIGAALAHQLAECGARLVLVGRDRSSLEPLASATEAVPILSNLAERGAAERVVAAVRAVAGEPDIVIHGEGSDVVGSLTSTPDSLLDEQLAVHAGCLLGLCRAALPAMWARGRGRVVALTNTAAVEGHPRALAACIARHATLGLVRALAAECEGRGVTVNAVATQLVVDDNEARGVAAMPDPPSFSPNPCAAEVAFAITSLLVDESRAVNGQLLVLGHRASWMR